VSSLLFEKCTTVVCYSDDQKHVSSYKMGLKTFKDHNHIALICVLICCKNQVWKCFCCLNIGPWGVYCSDDNMIWESDRYLIVNVCYQLSIKRDCPLYDLSMFQTQIFTYSGILFILYFVHFWNILFYVPLILNINSSWHDLRIK
jgi:hypothetical protein